MLVYIGTYTFYMCIDLDALNSKTINMVGKQGDSEGIYVYRLDTSSGALEYVSVATGLENPSFLDLHPHKPYLYAINEISESDGQSGGAITAFSIDEGTGELTRLNQQSDGWSGTVPPEH